LVWAHVPGDVSNLAEAIAPGEIWSTSWGQVQRWSGIAWTPVPFPFTIASTFRGLVRGSSASNVWLSYDAGLVARWDGVAWKDASPPLLPGGFTIRQMRVNGPGDVWTLRSRLTAPAGETMIALDHWDGSTWNQIPMPADLPPYPSVPALWATSAVDVWAAGWGVLSTGQDEPVLLHWDGSTLRRVSGGPFSSQPGGYIEGVWASSSTDVWVTGFLPASGSRLWHFDGTTWTEVVTPGMGRVTQLWGWCRTSLWALSQVGIWHYDGMGWSQGTNEALAMGVELSGTGPDDVLATVSNGVLRLQPPTCGDGQVSPGEECDPPRPVASGGIPVCDPTCHIPTCGNLKIDPGETCDPPDSVSCDGQCQLAPDRCGDGRVGPGEECDPPRRLGGTGIPVCDPTCHIPTCGNLKIDPGETCDPPDDGISCDSQCQSVAPVCGNGIVQAGEGCEFGENQICKSCQVTDCGSCFALWGINGHLCDGLSVADTISCNSLIGCMSGGIGACALNTGGIGCFCSDLSCSQGANGPCAAQMRALSHTSSNDPAEVLAAIRSGAVGRVVSAYYTFTTTSTGCYMHCPPN
jgi:hypothetical protein